MTDPVVALSARDGYIRHLTTQPSELRRARDVCGFVATYEVEGLRRRSSRLGFGPAENSVEKLLVHCTTRPPSGRSRRSRRHSPPS